MRGRYQNDKLTDPMIMVVRPVESDRDRDRPGFGQTEPMEIRIPGGIQERGSLCWLQINEQHV